MTGWKLGTLAVLHTGGGAVFSVAQAQDATVAAALAPAGWEQRGIAFSSPAGRYYVDPMEGVGWWGGGGGASCLECGTS